MANFRTWLAAAGQVLFTLSVGFGVIINHASYKEPKDDVALSGLTASTTNELFEVGFGGMITLTAACTFLGLSGTAGAAANGSFNLGFAALPMVFAQMGPMSKFIGAIWFLVLLLAAITSSLSMYQSAAAFLKESLGLSHGRATAAVAAPGILGTSLTLWYTADGAFWSTLDFWVGTLLLFVMAGIQTVASAFLDNVTTVIFVTPMALGLARRMRLAPMAILLPMVVASNIGGTATLIGDPPNIMIGSRAGLSFLEFVANLMAPVLVMLVALQVYTRWYHRDAYLGGAAGGDGEVYGEEAVIEDPVLLRWLMVICAGILVGFLTHSFTGMPVAVPAVIGAAAALLVQDVRYLRRWEPSAQERARGVLQVLQKDIEWPTLSFFVFLFILVGAAVETGLMSSVANGVAWSIGRVEAAWGLGDEGTLLFAAPRVRWVSAVLSAFLDNIPYVAFSIPVLHPIIPGLEGAAQVMLWALALGACLGANATVVGASAHVTTVGLAERGGAHIGFREYSRFAAPVATLTVAISSLFLAAYVYLGSGTAAAGSWALAVLLIAVEAGRRRATAA